MPRTTGPAAGDIEIREIDVGVRLEVLVADIPPADDRRGVVGDPRLLCMRRLSRTESDTYSSRRIIASGPRRRRGCRHAPRNWAAPRVSPVPLVTGDVEIVDQEPHAHAPLRSREQAGEQELAGRVVMNRVVLQVERALRRLGERRAQREASMPEAIR